MTPLPRTTPEPAASARPVAAARRAPWALMYHCVGDPADDPYRVTVSPDRLARQLRWLSRRGLTGVSMRELLAARARGRAARLVGLTFDDGYGDFLTEAVPLLRRYGHTATVFVLPGRLGGDNAWDPRGPRRPLLDAGGVRAAEAEGMEIGSHGLLHQDLTAADDAALSAEVTESRAWLADITGTVPGGFCYPYGRLDTRVVRAVRAAGYAYGCAVDPGPLAGPHALPRAYVGQRDNSPRLHAKQALHRLRAAHVPLPPEPADAASGEPVDRPAPEVPYTGRSLGASEPDVPHRHGPVGSHAPEVRYADGPVGGDGRDVPYGQRRVDPYRRRPPDPYGPQDGREPPAGGRRRTERNDTTGAGGPAAASRDTPAPPRDTRPPTEET